MLTGEILSLGKSTENETNEQGYLYYEVLCFRSRGATIGSVC